MVGTRTLRSWWSDYRCATSSQSRPITLFGLNAGAAATPAYDGFKALEKTLIATGYTGVRSVWIPRNCPTGISGRTCQADGDNCSLHNYRIAVDIDPFGYGNPHFQKAFGNGWNFGDCKITRAQVEAVEAIRNTNGEQYFRWLGWLIGDTMHFELQVPPSRTQVDWSTVPGGLGAQMFTSRGDTGDTVAYWQIVLKYQLGQDLGDWGDGSYGTPAGDGVDGVYGDAVANAVQAVARTSGEQIGPLTKARLDRAVIEAIGGGAGTQGPQGPKGDQGPPGPQGPKGDRGPGGRLIIEGEARVP